MWSIDKERTALLMIDMQNDFVREGSPAAVEMARDRIPAMARALQVCRQAGIPVLFTRHILFDNFEVSPVEAQYVPRGAGETLLNGTHGADVVDELRPLPEDIIIDKHRYDAFYDTPLQSVLAGLRGQGVVDTVIIAGTLTEVCCESTARSACARGFNVVFLADATGARTDSAQAASLSIIGRAFGRVLDVDDLTAELRAPASA